MQPRPRSSAPEPPLLLLAVGPLPRLSRLLRRTRGLSLRLVRKRLFQRRRGRRSGAAGPSPRGPRRHRRWFRRLLNALPLRRSRSLPSALHLAFQIGPTRRFRTRRCRSRRSLRRELRPLRPHLIPHPLCYRGSPACLSFSSVASGSARHRHGKCTRQFSERHFEPICPPWCEHVSHDPGNRPRFPDSFACTAP